MEYAIVGKDDIRCYYIRLSVVQDNYPVSCINISIITNDLKHGFEPLVAGSCETCVNHQHSHNVCDGVGCREAVHGSRFVPTTHSACVYVTA